MKNIRHESFVLSEEAAAIAGYELKSLAFRQAITRISDKELPGFLRAFVQEGIPAAFAKQPLLWEALREWVAQMIKSQPDNIAIVGSARLGFSPKYGSFGRPFGADSDLDISVVDAQQFELLWHDARKFIATPTVSIQPNATERKIALWEENRKVLHRTCNAGFADANKIPSHHNLFPTAGQLNNIASILKSKLDASKFPIRESSFRIYRSWGGFANQVRINYRSIRTQLM
jgi:hypothetical protein